MTRFVVAALLTLMLALSSAPGFAQQQSPLGAGPRPAAEKSVLAGRGAPEASTSRGWVNDAYAWLMAQQARVNRELAAAVRAIKSGDPTQATLLLALIAFTYGVLHAAGPGHGKAVISAYVLTNRQTVRRGILLSFMAALFQAISAIVIVGVLAILLKATSLTMRTTEAWIETVSWGLVALIGATLLRRQIAALRPAGPHLAGAPSHGGHAHVHHHEHHDHAGDGHHDHAHGDGHAHHHAHQHQHDHHHDHSECCGHAHMPTPAQLEGTWSWRRALAVAVAVGIRPCTGAILILVFALSQGLLWAGVFATFAMALGTAITVSVLAALAVGSRDMAARLAGGADSSWAIGVNRAAGFLGAALVFGLGSLFFVGSLTSSSPF